MSIIVFSVQNASRIIRDVFRAITGLKVKANFELIVVLGSIFDVEHDATNRTSISFFFVEI